MFLKILTVTLNILAALATGFWAIYLIGLSSVGAPWSWWYPVSLAASILLLVGGLHIAVPQLKQFWLVAVATGVSLLCWNLGTWFREGLMFAAVTGLGTWSALVFASFCKRNWVVSLIASLLLAAWWVPQAVRTLAAFFSPSASLAPSGLLWALAPMVLVTASLTAVIAISRASIARAAAP
jgi:hypothetical protein